MTREKDDEPDLSAWEAAEPPAGFADKVLAARRTELDKSAKPKPKSRRSAFAVGAAVVLAGAFVVLFMLPGTARGALRASERTTANLGRRAVAVAEPGAQLSWEVSRGGAARVTQTAGDVFYRVESGSTFVVVTPAGEVNVTGTCFRVEVVNMRPSKQALVGAAVGAALSAAVLVTVYEGKVILANEHGKTVVAAGERGSVGTGAAPGPAVVVVKGGGPDAPGARKIVIAPEPPPAAGVTRDELLKRDEAQRAELAKLRAQVAALEAGGGPEIKVKRGGGGDEPVGSFFAPSHDELLSMAKRCEVRYDTPPLGAQPFQIGPKMASNVGISEEERAKANAALVDFNNRVMAQLRAIYVEVTGNANAAEELTAQALQREIEEKSGRDETAEAMKRLSRERAGLEPPPADLATRPPVERMLRIMHQVGDAAEQSIGGAIGPDRAHQLRAEQDGWGGRTRMAGCADGTDGADD